MPAQSAKAWRCNVCGYIHRGDEPPAFCPVCGADRAEFEPYAEQAPARASAVTVRWECLNCGHVHEGEKPPGECPVCAAPSDRFEPRSEGEARAGQGAATGPFVVVGAGIAGISAVESIRRLSPDAEITLVSREKDLPYYRLNLTRFLAGEIDEKDLPIHPAGWYQEQKIGLLHGAEVSDLALEGRTVHLRDGRGIRYGKLILTVGAHPFIPPIPGANRGGVTSVRTADDARELLGMLRPGMKVACIGGGILGLETAAGLARRGARVTVLESFDWLMPRQLNQKAGRRLESYIKGLGIDLRLGVKIKEIVGDERAAGVLLEDGATVPADLVTITAGIRPNSHLARRAGLEVKQGIVVDDHLTSSNPDVLAAGDVAEHLGVLYGTWHASQYQGSIAGMNAAGQRSEFGGIPRSSTLKVLGINLVSIGKFQPDDGSYRVIERDEEDGYACFVFHDGCLVGSILIGDTAITTPLKKAIESCADFSGLLARGPSAADIMDHLAGGTM